MKTFFRQPCPVCGRPLNVPVNLLGSEAACSHCAANFIADGFEKEPIPDELYRNDRVIRRYDHQASIG